MSNKLYNMIYHFKDGTIWDEKENSLDAVQLPIILKKFQESPNVEITSLGKKETRKVSEIKSIELIF